MLLHEFTWEKEVLQAGEPVPVDFGAAWGRMHFIRPRRERKPS
jgi:hypothetical protein